MNKDIRVLIMAGGTGGHVFPALAVAQELLQRGVEVQWLGTSKGIEFELIPAANIKLNTIDIVGLRGKGLSIWFKMPFLLARAVMQASGILAQFKPQVVLGMGGFASGPGALAAKLRGIPIVLHEQNAVPGTTNKWLSKLTRHRLAAFPNSLKNAQVLGNPIRREITELPAPENKMRVESKALNLLVLGGSLGAKKLNELVPAALAEIENDKRPQVWHQSGKTTYQETLNAYKANGVESKVAPFIADMAEAYGWADIVICRAGALTVSEITAAGVAAIFVPFPHAIDDHQTQNALWLVNNKAGLLFQERDLDASTLATVLNELLSNSVRRNEMAINARALAKPLATETVAKICLEVARG